MALIAVMAALLAAALPAAAAGAETIFLKDGRQVETLEIIPEGNVLRVKSYASAEEIREKNLLPEQLEAARNQISWKEVRKKDLTPEEIDRYFGGGDGRYLRFETRSLGNGLEYDFYLNGRYVGRRVVDVDGWLLRADGEVPDGVYREFYPDNTVAKEKTMAGGRQTGPSRTYFSGGTLQTEAWFLDDKPHGPRKAYDKDGNLVTSEMYVSGRLAAAARD